MRIIFVIYCLLIPTLFFSCRSSLPTGVEVEEVNNYIDAEEYHQKYLEKNPTGYCHVDLSLAKKSL